MKEREPNKESIGKGELLYLWHPGTPSTFTGYGLTVQEGKKGKLTGLIMVDRPSKADPEWLDEIERTYGEYQLAPMTAGGDRGIVCQLSVEPESQQYLRRGPSEKSREIKESLKSLIEEPPSPVFNMWWDEDVHLWRSLMTAHMELSPELRTVFERTGYGSLAVETTRAVYHICHASDNDLENFVHKPVNFRWKLIKMPTAPLIRLDLRIMDRPENPFRFESFLNIADAEQALMLYQLANQAKLYLAFYGDDLGYSYTKEIPHGGQNWQQIDEIASEAIDHWNNIPPVFRDYNWAKAEFMRRYP